MILQSEADDYISSDDHLDFDKDNSFRLLISGDDLS